jgi:hypothetical protein
MSRSMFRLLFTMAVTLSLTFGVFAGFGVSPVAAASQPKAAAGLNPVASGPTEVNFCYPSGYNKQGWRCGWRLAMYPYPISTYNCGYYGNYYGGCGNYYGGYGYNNGYNGYNGYSGYGGRGNNGYIADYGGQPRYNPCYYNSCYNPCGSYNTCYNPCGSYGYGNYCGGYR